MYDKLNPTGALIECGFLSNYFDRTNLLNENYIKKLSAKITEALINYFYA